MRRRSGSLTRFVVGLTGGIGSGKSTAAAILGELGARNLDADRVVHRLYEPGGRGALALSSLLGKGLLDDAGAVDRPRLAARLFSDPELRAQVEGAIHPLVMAEIEAWLLAGAPDVLPVVEAALLVESGLYRHFSRVVLVSARPELQLARLQARHPDWSSAAIEARLRAQMPLEEKVRILAGAQVEVEHLDNSGGLEALRQACATLHRRLRAAQEAHRA